MFYDLSCNREKGEEEEEEVSNWCENIPF